MLPQQDDIVLVEGNNELNIGLVPMGIAQIISANWQLIEYPYVGYWPEETGPLTAYFCKCAMSVNSDTSFIGTVKVTCPYTISAVRVMTEYGYQAALDQMNEDIANSTGVLRDFYIRRRDIMLAFPQVDGFRIDYRWFSDPERMFRDWIVANVPSITLRNVVIPAGTSTVHIAFFKLDGAALIHPATIDIYREDELVASTVSNIIPPGEGPRLISINLPTSVSSGGPIPVSLVMNIPQSDQNHYHFWLRVDEREIECEIANAQYTLPSMYDTWISRGCFTRFLPLNSVDNNYTISGIWNGVEWESAIASQEFRRPITREKYYVPLPPGEYPVFLGGESWRIGVATQCGIYYYGLGPKARYNFGQVGTLVVA